MLLTNARTTLNASFLLANSEQASLRLIGRECRVIDLTVSITVCQVSGRIGNSSNNRHAHL